ncbi:WBP4 [Lepeophtheirus salmonis]|uniref:WBP4 n=1 Tax=Lepeophtheirus salmonis TaxID=72036 RepID=A0A7R8CYV8_LEPSM|nr:WBP4 [Lepeophtheirus salmonis]CAF2971277.1 WBP4 [Lepeophtheirus salmonis]
MSIMTEYWKSQAKKFCQYCKVWITDNKASDIRRKGMEDLRNSRDEAAMLRQMEEDALNTYRMKDLDSNSDITASIFNKRRAEMRENRRISEEAAAEGFNDEMSKAEIAALNAAANSDSIGPSIGPQSGPNVIRRMEAPRSGTKWHKSESSKGPKKWYEALMDDDSGTKEQHDINRKAEAKTLHRNASILASQSIHGKGEIVSYSDVSTTSYQEPQTYDPYGGWQNVQPKPTVPTSKIDYQCPQAKAPIQSSVTLHSERDRYSFKEKTVSTLYEDNTELPESHVQKIQNFLQKTQIDSVDKKRNMRQRDDNL